MSNQNYAQVANMVSAGELRWATDQIVALLLKDAAFVSTHQRLSDVTPRTYLASAAIQGRWLGEGGMAMGLPAFFQKVALGDAFQVLVAQDDGRSDPRLLAFMDEDSEGSAISLLRTGTLIIRPSQENPPTPPEMMTPPPTTGFWMKL